jgi:hypothetical protein
VKHFERKADAERFLTRVQSQVLDRSYIDPPEGHVLMRDHAAAWQAAQLHRPTTVLQVDAQLRNHVLPAFGGRPLASLRPTEIQGWVRHLSESLAPATVEVVYRLLSAILKDAIADRPEPRPGRAAPAGRRRRSCRRRSARSRP